MMPITRREMLASAAMQAAAPAAGVTHYVRYSLRGGISYGVLEGDRIQPLSGSIFDKPKPSGKAVAAASVKLLAPCVPPKVLAVGLNYKSHIGNRPAPKRPEIFYKPVTCIQNPGDPIVIPADSKNTHYEGELVIVIGKGPGRIFGYTCGNDVSERDWQNGADKDLQWWRAKGADTFGPLGPVIAVGLDPKPSQLVTRLNGNVVQKQFVSDLLFDCEAIVAFVARYVTLTPGDVIYTGTPGATKALAAGDVVEVEIGGIGTLRNPVKAG
ncbi:MAG TPA: fumarylacetoacetate hydrolase family protein [Paludibaculum sp.]|jgi:2-keto-4-pentenoate hydratase/2-oxohepta-3-ene-1,7-dioic acid hydratase in catechol pathway